MTQVSSSAAYVRKGSGSAQASLHAANLRGSMLELQVLSLLETPQTLESLQRATRRTSGTERQVDSDNIEKTLEQLLDADLIELSPDS